MRSHVQVTSVKAAAIVAGCLLSGCSTESFQLPSSPEALAPRFSQVGGLAVLSTQLGALLGTTASATGPIQLKLYAQPNDPCGPVVSSAVSTGFAAIAICGNIMNPQNDNIVSNAGLFFIPQVPSDVDAILVAGLIVSIPPNPIDQCRSFSVRGGTQVSQALANAIVASPAQYQIRFGALGGLFGIPPNPVKAFQPTDPIIPTAAKCVAIVTGTF